MPAAAVTPLTDEEVKASEAYLIIYTQFATPKGIQVEVGKEYWPRSSTTWSTARRRRAICASRRSCTIPSARGAATAGSCRSAMWRCCRQPAVTSKCQ